MVKLLGILLAFIASAAIGFLKASEVKKRKTLLMDFKEMILHISTEMSYFKEPLPQIFERLIGENDQETSILLRECLLRYQSENLNLSDIWRQAVEHVYKGEPVSREDLSVMKKCSEFLGQSDFKGQQDHFRLLGLQIDRQLAEAEEAIKTKGRMYGKMGVSVGLVIAIVLI